VTIKRSKRSHTSTSWDPVADWYVGWVGEKGSDHHRKLAIPAVLDLLAPTAHEQILDVGAGPGVLAPQIARAGAHYTGVDASPRMLAFARRHHGAHGTFLLGDATRLEGIPQLRPHSFDGVVFMLSIQDIDPLDAALRSAAWALRSGGRLVLLMTHPCFRVPRQSGWGWDANRRLRFRRVDRYLTPLMPPMKRYGDRGATRSYHRPLEMYVNGLSEQGLLIEQIREIPTFVRQGKGQRTHAEQLSDEEIPLFLGIRAVLRG